MSPAVGLFFDVLILVALGVTIFYCLRLSRQFEQMRADRQAFDALIKALNFASARAEASIQSFKEVATGGGDILQDKINKAHAMTEELEIVIEAGDSLADRLQDLAEKSGKAAAEKSRKAPTDQDAEPRQPKPAVAAETKHSPAAEPRHSLAAEPRTRAEKELLEAVKAKQQT